MERDGDTLHAKFETLPADTIGITTTAPTNALFRVLRAVTPIAFWLVVVVGPFALWRLGARRGRSGLEAAAVLHGLGYAIALLGFGVLAIDGGDVALAAGQIASHGYAGAVELFGLVLLLIVAWPVGGLITRAAWKRHRVLPV
jgi:Na+/H+ antiporter NhaC